MKYKLTKVYEVEASSKEEAIEKITKDPETLVYVSVTKIVDKGFWAQTKNQLTGK